MNEITVGNLRVQFLQDDIIRIEQAKNGKFCNGNTLVVPDRTQFDYSSVAFTVENNEICFGEYKLILPAKGKSILGTRLEKNGKVVYRYKKINNSGELPSLDSTPDVFAVSDCPRIVLPDGGYSYRGKRKNSGYNIQENVRDIYLFLCRGEAEKLRYLYVQLTGKIELPPISVFGSWNSKYFRYNEDTAKELIEDYERYQIPLDYMVIDTDWRASSGTGIGYDVNTELFPDMKRFIDFAHSRGVEIMFNDHPEPVLDADNVFAPAEVKYRETKLQNLLDCGLDIWWYDRNWPTKLKSPTKDVNPETLGLYLFEEITRHYRQRVAGDNEIYQRPVVMGNADNVSNGLYLGIASSASHRFGLQWTGDIMSDPDALAQEIYNLIRGGNNEIVYLNADCGGHQGNPDKEWFIRWMQFGTLSPIFRPHCSDLVTRTREPWVFGEETCNIVREYINCRYRLLPVIYQSAHLAYTNGIPVFKSLGWNYPEDKKALKCTDEYMLGKNLLIAPIAGNLVAPLNKRHYVQKVKAAYYDGMKCEGPVLATAEYSTISMRCNFNSPENNVPVFNFSAIFETEIRFEESVKLILRCDDGATVWLDGQEVLRDDTLHSAKNFDLAILEPNRTYHIKIKYFQAGGEAECSLYYVKVNESSRKKVYLPKGKWLDVFNGKIYTGNKIIGREYSLREMPLFVRTGALIPLAFNVKNTKEQKWDKLVYDFYPEKTASDSGYLYEDDGVTTAYKFGKYRISPYEAKFSKEDNAFVVVLHAAEGDFDGEKAFESREITLKYHLFKGSEAVRKITVNDKDCNYILSKKKRSAFPFNTEINSSDGEVISVSLSCDIRKDYEIKFYL